MITPIRGRKPITTKEAKRLAKLEMITPIRGRKLLYEKPNIKPIYIRNDNPDKGTETFFKFFYIFF